jgi:hypothetical protein
MWWVGAFIRIYLSCTIPFSVFYLFQVSLILFLFRWSHSAFSFFLLLVRSLNVFSILVTSLFNSVQTFGVWPSDFCLSLARLHSWTYWIILVYDYMHSCISKPMISVWFSAPYFLSCTCVFLQVCSTLFLLSLSLNNSFALVWLSCTSLLFSSKFGQCFLLFVELVVVTLNEFFCFCAPTSNGLGLSLVWIFHLDSFHFSLS